VNGLALAIWIYTAANISGGHLNPAVTFSTLICGFYPVMHSILYITMQVSKHACNCTANRKPIRPSSETPHGSSEPPSCYADICFSFMITF
jgi:hypothetical protein